MVKNSGHWCNMFYCKIPCALQTVVICIIKPKCVPINVWTSTEFDLFYEKKKNKNADLPL